MKRILIVEGVGESREEAEVGMETVFSPDEVAEAEIVIALNESGQGHVLKARDSELEYEVEARIL